MTPDDVRKVAPDAAMWLLENLISIMESVDASEDHGDSRIHRTQDAALEQLNLIIRLLEGLGANPQLCMPLSQLSLALQDAKAGVKNPLLNPRSVPTKTARTNTRTWAHEILVWTRAVVAVVAERKVDGLMHIDEAIEKVAPYAEGALGPLSIKPDSSVASGLRYHFDRLPKGMSDSVEMQKEYDRYLKTGLGVKSYRRIADQALASLTLNVFPAELS